MAKDTKTKRQVAMDIKKKQKRNFKFSVGKDSRIEDRLKTANKAETYSLDTRQEEILRRKLWRMRG